MKKGYLSSTWCLEVSLSLCHGCLFAEGKGVLLIHNCPIVLQHGNIAGSELKAWRKGESS